MKTTRKISHSIVMSALLSVCTDATARWKTLEEADAQVLEHKQTVVVDETGQSVTTVSQTVEILTEQGLENLGTLSFDYDGGSEEWELVEAKVETDGEDYPFDPGLMERKAIASEAIGLDDTYQVLIPFDNVEVGSKISFTYVCKKRKEVIPNYFELREDYLYESPILKAKIKIESALPLFFEMNDPKNSFNFTQSQDRCKFKLELNKPLYEDLTNEPEEAVIGSTEYTWFMLSSINSKEELARQIAVAYQPIMQAPLPPLYEKIRQEAAASENPVDQMNIVIMRLGKKIRYMGDWQTREGGHIPKSLAETATKRMGDCKDYSAATAAILNQLGFSANIAFVYSGPLHLPEQDKLPTMSSTNHAIVKASDHEGKVYWLDPTTQKGMAQGIVPDISDRPAYVLSVSNPTYEMIPPINFHSAQQYRTEVIEIIEDDGCHIEGSIKFKGERAYDLTGILRHVSEKTLHDQIKMALSSDSSTSEFNAIFPGLKSPIVRDFELQYINKEKDLLALSNMGYVFHLWNDFFSRSFLTIPDIVSHFYLGPPSTQRIERMINGMTADNLSSLNFDVETPWLWVKRVCESVDGGIRIYDELKLLKSFISPDEIRSEVYQNLKRTLKKATKSHIILKDK